MHRRGSIDEIPALRMLALPANTIEKRARILIEQLAGDAQIEATIITGQSAVGGGSGPNVHPQTALIAIKHHILSADEVEVKLRHYSPPIIARIADGLVLIDLRTVDAGEEDDLLSALTSLGNSLSPNPSFK